MAFAAALGNAAPIFLYNIPAFAGAMARSTITQLLATGLFAGIKESSQNIEDVQVLAEHMRGTPLTLWAGCERIYVPAKRLGIQGIVSGVASAVPELMVALNEALANDAHPRVAKLEARVGEFLNWIEVLPFPTGIKEATK